MSAGRKLVIAGAAALLLAAGGVGIAQAVGGDSEEQVTGPEAESAKSAAVEAVGGGRAAEVERGDDDGAAWEVEVQKGGRELEVNLDSDLQPVGPATGDDGGGSENDEGETEDED
jgi:hypothetical protein